MIVGVIWQGGSRVDALVGSLQLAVLTVVDLITETLTAVFVTVNKVEVVVRTTFGGVIVTKSCQSGSFHRRISCTCLGDCGRWQCDSLDGQGS
jgi:hypothetical protein